MHPPEIHGKGGGKLMPSKPPQISVSGHVYDLETGLVTTIVGP
jgi:hypothetical protein